MTTFQHIEDYIEIISGNMDPKTGKRNQGFLGMAVFEPIINLANYDTPVLNSMNSQVVSGQALTERQAGLACKIILKYQRQLAARGIDVSSAENPKYRMPLRRLDYSKRLSIVNDCIQLHFPYNTHLINDVRNFVSKSQGSAVWDKDTKAWNIALTEFNLSWLYAWCTMQNFEIGNSVKDLMQKIEQVEQSEFAIELCYNGTDLYISNCPDSLKSHIEEKMGGFNFDNLLNLVDASSILGYTVSSDIADVIASEYGIKFYTLSHNRELKIKLDDFDSIIDYADRIGRWPVVIYEPDLSDKLLKKIHDIRPGMFYANGQTRNPTIDPGFRYIHTAVPVTNIESIPLLISSAGMIVGGDKILMLQHADKIVYTSHEVYKKNNPQKVKQY